MDDGEGGWYGSPRKLQVFALGIITIYIGGILCIWVAAPTLEFEAYPSDCPIDSKNCSRIAPNSYHGNGEDNLVVNGSKEEVMAEIGDRVRSINEASMKRAQAPKRQNKKKTKKSS